MRYSKHSIRIDGINYRQLSKTTARKMFSEGEKIYLHPCNMSLFSHWSSLCPIERDEIDLQSTIDHAHFCVNNNFEIQYLPDVTFEMQFDTLVNSYESYNCVAELGKYANYFVEEKAQ